MNQPFSAICRAIAFGLSLVAIVIATATPTLLHQAAPKSYSIFEGSHQWYPVANNPLYQGAGTANPLYQGPAIAVIMANHNFDAQATQP
jgi:hypothetical protein